MQPETTYNEQPETGAHPDVELENHSHATDEGTDEDNEDANADEALVRLWSNNFPLESIILITNLLTGK